MKYSIFEGMGAEYPHALENKFERILIKIVELWHTPQIQDYFSDLIIDRRGGRAGFPKDVLDDIIRVRQFHQVYSLTHQNDRAHALAELKRRDIMVKAENLFAAIESGDQGLVDLLVRAGINVHVKDDHGNAPLMLALRKGYTVIAIILIKAGVEVNEYDRSGETPLLISCSQAGPGFKSVADQLLVRGAFIEERGRNGFTPLMLAIQAGATETAKLLIERGANVSSGTLRGESPLGLALEQGNHVLVDLLKAQGARL